MLFFFFRPWVLVLAGLWIADWGWRARAAGYALILGIAGASESLFLLGLGGDPWVELARGLAAGIAAALAIDLLIQLGRPAGCLGQALSAVACAMLLLTPAYRPVEELALGPTGSRPVAVKPDLLLMTGLPLVWGETGPFDPGSRPAAAYRALQEEFDVRPVDYLDGRVLGGARLMLLAQPRTLEPAELVALDAWVRRGGRILILADPELDWPTRLPLGDFRRPPPSSLLAPLLSHWNLELRPPAESRLEIRHLRDGANLHRLTLVAAGRLQAGGGPCRTGRSGLFAFCAVGEGRALLVGDADLMRDDLWTSVGPRGMERHARLADNPLLVARWLDRLAGVERERAARPVRWLRPQANRRLALILASVPLLLVLAAGVAARWASR